MSAEANIEEAFINIGAAMNQGNKEANSEKK